MHLSEHTKSGQCSFGQDIIVGLFQEFILPSSIHIGPSNILIEVLVISKDIAHFFFKQNTLFTLFLAASVWAHNLLKSLCGFTVGFRIATDYLLFDCHSSKHNKAYDIL